jgi:hypothetical protein
VKAWLIAYHECVAVRILCEARGVFHNISKRYRFATFLENPLRRVVLRMSSMPSSLLVLVATSPAFFAGLVAWSTRRLQDRGSAINTPERLQARGG